MFDFSDDWTSFVGDPTKLGLGLFSVAFDILFILQHYVCFRNRRDSPREDARSLVPETGDGGAPTGNGNGSRQEVIPPPIRPPQAMDPTRSVWDITRTIDSGLLWPRQTEKGLKTQP